MFQEVDLNKLYFLTISAEYEHDHSTSGFRINYNFNTHQQREVEIIFVSDHKRYGQLCKGDILLQINGKNVDSMSEKDLNRFVLNSSNPKVIDEYLHIKYLTIYRPFSEDQINDHDQDDNDNVSQNNLEEHDAEQSVNHEQVQQQPIVNGNHQINAPISSSTPMRNKLTSQDSVTNGDAKSDEYEVEEILIKKVNGAMGLSIVGGGNVACHPFGVEKPGIFISKIVPDGAASRTNLRVGDRILKVNGVDVTDFTHDQTVVELKQNSSQVVLLVSHDPQPSGMQEIVLQRSYPEETLGIRINGGVENKSPNVYDPSDEGIFVVNIINGTLAQKDGRLKVGTRIMEVC